MFNKNKNLRVKKAFENLKENFIKAVDRHEVIQFVPATEKIDKTSIILNLGRILTKNGYKVIIIESDFRNPTLSEKAEVEINRGLVDILEKERPYENYIINDSIEKGLDMILAPEKREDTLGFLDIDRLDDIFYLLSEKYDYILLDTASNEKNDDAHFYADLVDSVMILAPKKDFRDKKLKNALEKLENVGAKISAIIKTEK
ncbi:AAA family ATPase [Anaerococcus porci]|uniref:AAA family ATPase n=1 Tax=Anaerococcus porci TaxID=2652269 RepID=UPI002A7489B9|nr:AAA family ATPase [Anaerococcus porci]MDY3005921.1 AAA family ATPase [Anaerococcus porci]